MAALVILLFLEIREDNVISMEMVKKNEVPYQVMGQEAVEFPWADSLRNMDPKNNGKVRIDKWNFRKVQIRGYFEKKAVLGKKTKRNNKSEKTKPPRRRWCVCIPAFYHQKRGRIRSKSIKH